MKRSLRLAWALAVVAAWLVAGVRPGPARGGEKVIRVLMTTGDWKNQPWYQNRWMRDKEGRPRIFRGRFIQKKVAEAAPGRFAFTHVPNYIAQEYLDSDYLSQFDVLLIGDIMVHLSDKFQTAVRGFVRDGGGLIYCANHKWGIGMKGKGQPFEQVLPAAWPDRDAKGDYKGWLDHRNFAPVVTAAEHPLIRGLDWNSAPPLGRAVNMPAKKGATVLLTTPRVAVRPWQVVGPFPNENKAGFDTVYEPENGVKLDKAYTIPGIEAPVRWKKAAGNAAGFVDLVPHFTPNEYVCAYAVAYVKSPSARKVLCVGAADDWRSVLEPVVGRYRPLDILRFFRGDAAFARPGVYEFLEFERFLYAIRLPANAVLYREVEPFLTRPVGRPSNKPVVWYHDFQYQASTWNKPRRVVAKIEHHKGELFPRVGFIVTNLRRKPWKVVEFYNGRGTAEQWIKEGKNAVKWTKLSCHDFVDNQVRLQLFALAYNLGNFLRRLALPRSVKHWSLTTLREKLIKIGAKVITHARYVIFQLAEVAVPKRLFRAILARIERLRLPQAVPG